MENLVVQWAELLLEDAAGNACLLRVTADACRRQMPDGSTMRFAVSAREQQIIADRLGASLLTAKLADAIHAAAPRVAEPETQINGVIVARSIPAAVFARMDASLGIKADQPLPEPPVLTSGVCKDWILSPRMRGTVAINHGFHARRTPKTPGYRTRWKADLQIRLCPSPQGPVVPLRPGPPVPLRPADYAWQVEGGVHNIWHSDPSQLCRLVHQGVVQRQGVRGDWVPATFTGLLANPVLAHLVSYDGPFAARVPT